MKSLEYRNYISQVIRLARSIILKSDHTADSLNNYLSAVGETVYEDKNTWKYYCNLNGEYYTSGLTSANDSMISVISLDTEEVIDFSKESLASMPYTLREYRKRGHYYTTLVKKYPEHKILIDGILFPTPKSTAIAAENYKILKYDTTLVLPNERSLIPELQKFIYDFAWRWDIYSYAAVDTLYPAAFETMLYLAIVTKIINLRLSKVKTREVHSFHLWSYLGGYYEIDQFRKDLDYRQALFLYKNIDYVTNLKGMSGTLDFVYENAGKPYNLVMEAIKLEQSREGIIDNLNSGGTNTIPETVINKYDYCAREDRPVGSLPVDSFIEKRLSSTARNNERYLLEDTEKVIDIPKKTLTKTIPTGVLEFSRKINAYELYTEEVKSKIGAWIFYTSTGAYSRRERITLNLSTGTSVIELDSSEALTLLIWMGRVYNGLDNTDIPKLIARKIGHLSPLSKEQLSGIIEDKYLNRLIGYDENGPIYINLYDMMFSTIPHVNIIDSLDKFKEIVDALAIAKMLHTHYLSTETNALGRGQIENYIGNFYSDVEYTPTEFTDYASFFNSIGFTPSESITEEDALRSIDAILKSFADVSILSQILRPVQRGIKGVIDIIVSHTVTSVLSNETWNIVPIKGPFIKDHLHELNESLESYQPFDTFSVDGVDFSQSEDIKTELSDAPKITSYVSNLRYNTESTLNISISHHGHTHHIYELGHTVSIIIGD